MRIAVVGAGAVGTWYGARLLLAGEDVRFLMRSDLEHVRRHGLVLRTHDGDRHLPDVRAYGSTAEIGPVDVVLVAAKTTANAAMPDLVRPLVGEGTWIVTLQNGLGNEEFFAARFGAERLAGMLCFVCLNRIAPGVIENFHPGLVSLGEFGRPLAERTRALGAALEKGGVRVKLADSLVEQRWRKLMWNIPFNGLAIAGGGIDTQGILARPDLVARAEALMREVTAAAARHGIAIPEAFLQTQFQVTREMGPYKPSSLIDYLAGREVEVDAIWGEPLRRARAAGVPTPELERLHAELLRLCRT